MSEIEKISRYIELTENVGANRSYQMNMLEILELRKMAEDQAYSALALAFDYGKAKGYRAAKAEARR